jgi:hypothetical protein
MEVTTLRALCESKIVAGDFEGVEREAAIVLEAQPDNPEGHFWRGRAWFGLKQYRNAAREFATAAVGLGSAGGGAYTLKREECAAWTKRSGEFAKQTQGVYNWGAFLEASCSSETLKCAEFFHPRLKVAPAGGNKGLGVFVSEGRIEPGELLLVEPAQGVVWKHEVSSTNVHFNIDDMSYDDPTTVCLTEKLASLPESLKSRVLSLTSGRWGEIAASSGREDSLGEEEKLRNVINANKYGTHMLPRGLTCLAGKTEEPSDGTALFFTAARFNHSCWPTCHFESFKGIMVIRAIRSAVEGEELTIAYVPGSAPLNVRQERLSNRGFTCVCQRCEAQQQISHVLVSIEEEAGPRGPLRVATRAGDRRALIKIKARLKGLRDLKSPLATAPLEYFLNLLAGSICVALSDALQAAQYYGDAYAVHESGLAGWEPLTVADTALQCAMACNAMGNSLECVA